MALKERLVQIDTAAVIRVARRELARALRYAADRLREPDEDVVSGPASAAAAAPDPTPTPQDPPAEGERHGAARWVDAQQQAPAGPEAVEVAPSHDDPPVDLLGLASGDLGPALAERTRSATQQDTTLPGDDDAGIIHDRVVAQLHTIFDPEIPIDIYDLGLIYAVDVREDRSVGVRMTLTSPNCPAAQSLPSEVEVKVEQIPGVVRADVDVVFDPPWTPDLMSEEAKLELNIL